MRLSLAALAGAILLCSCGGIRGDWKNVHSPDKRWQITGDTMVHLATGTMIAKWKYKWVDDQTIEISDYNSGEALRKVKITWQGSRLQLDFGDGNGPTELSRD